MNPAGLRVAICGVGRFGALHARVWAEAGARVVGACDPDPVRLAAIAARHDIAATAPDLPALLERVGVAGGVDGATAGPSSGGIDAVVVASDEASHASLATTALAAGLHVFVEKPLALSSVDARRIQAYARDNQRHVVTGNISRFAAPYVRMRSRLAAGALGRLGAIRLRRDFSAAWFRAFGERVHPVWESCIHDIDLAIAFTGTPVRRVLATSSTATKDTERSVLAALLEFDDGVIATVESAWLLPETAPHTITGALELDGTIAGEAELLGTAGVVRQRLVGDGLQEWTASGSVVPDLSLWPDDGGRVGGALRAEVEYALAVFEGRRAHDVVPLDQACWGVEAAEAIETALRTREPVELAARPVADT